MQCHRSIFPSHSCSPDRSGWIFWHSKLEIATATVHSQHMSVLTMVARQGRSTCCRQSYACLSCMHEMWGIAEIAKASLNCSMQALCRLQSAFGNLKNLRLLQDTARLIDSAQKDNYCETQTCDQEAHCLMPLLIRMTSDQDECLPMQKNAIHCAHMLHPAGTSG